MALRFQVLTDYTEGGADAAQISQTSRVASWTDLERQDEAYLSYDHGAGFFTGDFKHQFVLEMTAGPDAVDSQNYLYPFMLTQGIGSVVDLNTANTDYIAVAFQQSGGTQKYLQLVEQRSGTVYASEDQIVLDPGLNTKYWVTVERSSNNLILTARNNSHSGAVEGTDTFALQSAEAYRYTLVTVSIESGNSPTAKSSGTLADLDLFAGDRVVRDLSYGSLYGLGPDNDLDTLDKQPSYGWLYGPLVGGEPTPVGGGDSYPYLLSMKTKRFQYMIIR